MPNYGRRMTRRNANTALVVLFALVLLLILPLASAYAVTSTVTLSKRTVGSTSVSLAWTTSVPTGVVVSYYMVNYGLQGGTTCLPRKVSAKYSTIYGLQPGSTYWFRVTAFVSPGSPIDSNTLLVTTTGGTTPPSPPAAPSNLIATSGSPNKIDLQWTDNSANETGFRVEQVTSEGVLIRQVVQTGANTRAYSCTGLAESTTYFYRVYAYNGAGNSAYSNTVSAATSATLPVAPTGAVATPVSPTAIGLRWSDNSSNETDFRIMRAMTSGGTYYAVGSVTAGTTSYLDEGLQESTTYHYRIYSVNSAGSSNSYASAYATTPATVPSAPEGLSANPVSSSRIDLQWIDASANETGFVIERTAGSDDAVRTVNVAAGATSYSDTGLSAATTYHYRVCALNSAGNSAYAGPVDATTFETIPSAPSNLTASAISSVTIDLKWADNSSNETGFVVERATASSGPFTPIATKSANEASHLDTGLSASTTYYYRVCATNSAGTSAFTALANATTQAPPPTPPSAPDGLAVSVVSSKELKLTWHDTSGDETGFLIERSTSTAGPFAQIATVATGVTGYSSTGLAASTTYYYRVCAYNSAGNSTYAGPVNATTLADTPAAPTSLTATAVSSSKIDLKWSDNSSNETGFIVERASGLGGPYTQIATAASGATSYQDTGLSASTIYYYRVCAYNSAGNSAYTSPASAATPADPPAAPSNLVPTAVSSSQVDLKWADNSWNETGFKIERGTAAAGPFTQIATVASGVTGYSNTGLTASTTYYYRVCSYNSVGPSEYAGPASVTTPAPIPATPSNLSATAMSSDRIDLKWSDNSSNETGFAIERGLSQTGPYTAVATTAAGATSYSDAGQGLTEDTTYYYRVCAVNGSSQSGFTTAAYATTKLIAPADLQATAGSFTTVNLTWTDRSAHEANYVVERSLQGTDGTWGPLTTLPANSTSYSDQTCQALTRYYYRVYATGSISDPSNTASVITPDEPIQPRWIGKTPVVGEAYWTAVSGSYAYVTSSTGLQIVDISDPSDPLVKSSVDMTYPYDVAADGNGYVYVGAGKSLQIIDVQDPAIPDVVATLPMPDYAQGVYVSGSRAYVACYAAGMAIVDITNPGSPQQLSVVDTPGYATSVAVIGNTAVVADTSSMLTVDVTDPASPSILGSIAAGAVDVAAENGYAYAATGTSGLMVVDVRDAANPVAVGTGRATMFGSALGVSVSGGRAYVASFSYNSTDNGLQVFDLADPSAPAQTAFLPVSGRTRGGIAAEGSVVCLATGSGGLNVIDVSAPYAPVLNMRMPETMQSRAIVADGDYIYTLSYSSVQSRLYVYNVSDPATPDQCGHVDLAYPFDMALQGTWAYVCDNKSLKIVDVQDPTAPVVVATLPLPDYAMGVHLSGTRAYVACYAAGVVIVDITNPYAPAVLSVSDTPGTALSVSVTGSTAVVADGTSVQLFDVANPAAVVAVGSVATSDRAVDVASKDGYAYVAASTAGMIVIDVRRPGSPQVIGIGRPTLFGSASGIALSGGRAFIASFSYNTSGNGLQVFSLADPAAPMQAAFLVSRGRYCRTIAVSDRNVYLTDDKFLVQVAGF